MLGGNDFITIWNRLGDKYYRHEIHAKCRYTQRSNHRSTGAGDTQNPSLLSTLVCRIPYVDNYLKPESWQNLSEEERSKYFTVQIDDYLALGIHKYEIGKNSAAGEITIPDLRRKLQSDIMQAKAVRYSTKAMLGKHIRAEGV